MTKLFSKSSLAALLSLALYIVVYFVQKEFLVLPGVNELSFERMMILSYAIITAIIFGLYFWLFKTGIELALKDSFTEKVLWLVPLLICIFAIFCRPVFSDDLWSYISSGFFSDLPGDNTYLHMAADIAKFPIASEFAQLGAVPVTSVTPYGPIWSLFEWFAFHISPNVGVAAIVLKLGVCAAIFGCTWLISKIAKILDPSRYKWLALAFLWNPLILVEIAFEGHNDIWMIFFILVALYFASRNKLMRSLFALWIGVLCKFLPLIYFPAFAVFTLRNSKPNPAFFKKLLFLVALCAFTTIVLYLPFWSAGIHCFDGVLGMREKSQVTLSYWIERSLGYVMKAPYPARISTVIVDIGFVLLVLWISMKVKTFKDLARAYLGISTSYLFINSKRFWPWYPDMPLSAAALLDGPWSLFFFIILPLFSRYGAPVSVLRNAGWITMKQGGYYFMAIQVVIPILILCAIAFKRFLSSRMQESTKP